MVADLSSIQITTLSNGLRVATDHMPGIESATLGVWTACGARYETPAQNGMAHFLEHMVFKGTTTRNAREIAEEIEAVGGHLNAGTGRETTAYYVRLLKDDVATGLNLIADMLNNSTFDNEELERERGVVLQEIGQSHDTPDDVVFDYFQETALPQQAIGRPILGTPETVNSFSSNDLRAFIGQHYVPSNMVVLAAGNVQHQQIVELAEANFAHLPPAPIALPEKANYQGGFYRKQEDLEQLHLVMGFKGASYHDDDYFVAQIFSTILGGGMSSRLFQEIREKRGLVYSIYSFNSAYRDAGVFGIYAGTSPEKAEELISVVCSEIANAAQHITPQELQRARAQVKSSLLMGLESSMSRAEQLGQHLLMFNRPITSGEILQRVEKVDIKALQQQAEKLLASPFTLAALGGLGNLPDEEKIKKMLTA
ncbi:MAG: M16 family metallopeptidase [Alphaproteobacteria bacterium]